MPEKPIVIERVIPGAFYQSVQAGHYTDPVTGISIPGPIVKIDEVTRQVAEVASMRDPVQLPYFKRTFDIKDPKIKVDAPFDRIDAEGTCEGLNMALATGIIRRVPDEEVQALYPEAYAKRDKHKTFNPDGQAIVPMASLVDAFQEKMRKAKYGVAERKETADSALGATTSRTTRRKAVAAVAETETATE